MLFDGKRQELLTYARNIGVSPRWYWTNSKLSNEISKRALEISSKRHPLTRIKDDCGEWISVSLTYDSEEAYLRGRQDAVQDYFENCPFTSVGGLDARPNIKAPRYIDSGVAEKYLEGYTAFYGKHWATIEFSWQPALTLDNDPSVPRAKIPVEFNSNLPGGARYPDEEEN